MQKDRIMLSNDSFELHIRGYENSSSICLSAIDERGMEHQLTLPGEEDTPFGSYFNATEFPELFVHFLQNKFGCVLPIYNSSNSPFFVYNKDILQQYEPVGLKTYEQHLNKLNVIDFRKSKESIDDICFDEIKIFGKTALMTVKHVDSSQLYPGLYAYDIVRLKDFGHNPSLALYSSPTDHYATIIMAEKLDIPRLRNKEIRDEDISFIGKESYLKDFCIKKNITMECENRRKMKR